MDGATSTNGNSTCAGLIRDDRGKWILGFQKQCGQTSPQVAELCAIEAGLQICKQHNMRRIKLYSDSLDSIQLLFRDCVISHPMYDLISSIRSLIFSNWDLEISHTYREATKCADILAKQAFSISTCSLILNSPPEWCVDQLRSDFVTYEGPVHGPRGLDLWSCNLKL